MTGEEGATILGERYRVVGVLGEGGMGIVYDAIDLHHGAPVAVKVLFPERTNTPSAFKRFKREVRILGALDVPQVCRIYDVGILGTGEPYFVMERVPGETLRARLDRQGRLSYDESLWIASEVLAALGAAHSHGVVHRDVKPENIILGDGARPPIKLIDFGVAKLRASSKASDDDTAANVTLTKAGTVIGTMWYVSPEQARGEEVDARSDVWSTGVVLYEMLTGHKPFDSERVVTLVALVVRAQHEPPSVFREDMPTWLEALVERTLQRDRSLRFQDGASFRAELVSAWNAASESLPSASPAASPIRAEDARPTSSGVASEVDGKTIEQPTTFDSEPPPDDDTREWVR